MTLDPWRWWENEAAGAHFFAANTNSALPSQPASDSLDNMAKTDVIEFTHEYVPESTSIAHVYYNQNTNRMTVEFAAGGVYSYDETPYSIYAGFLEADSAGTYYRKVVLNPQAPGAKHNANRIRFVAVDVEEDVPHVDTDATKIEYLTGGKGRKFRIDFEFVSKDSLTVRAEDMDKALVMFNEYMAGQGIEFLTVKGVFVDFTE